jgi:aromatic ring-opening dioxygenase catalytic subunit (LigB family)
LFEEWLIKTCSDTEISETERVQRFADWTDAPGARFCHPREEHLIPLHLCYGAIESACQATFELSIMGKKTSMYLW